MVAATPESLDNFVNFCKQHIKGQEKKEAQIFLDRFFQAFGHEGALEAGASYEEAIKQGSKKGKTGFADLVWKPRVLIEMKKRGEDLSKHYSQAFDYWTRLVPDRPRYVLLCNFDKFWIFDFDIQVDTPVDVIALEQLPERAGAFAFMEFGDKTPVFRNNQLEVTERAARRMGELLLELEKRGIEKLTAQRFILQCVLAMFAEDRQLLPRDMFVSCVQDCMSGASSYDVLGGLFREMNLPGITPAGRYKGVDYFNGGLFSQIQAIELTREELNFLDVSAKENWSKVRPPIFGNLFEATVDKKERHTRGIHFTSEPDIMKIVRPTISRYWEEKIEVSTLPFYFIVPRHSKWFIFIPAQPHWLPADSTTVVASDDFYILGILTSKVHRFWVKAQSSTLKSDTRYTHNTCFETFPFPQTPNIKLVQKIRSKAEELYQYRTQQMESKKCGITILYNNFFDEPTSQLYKLHEQLDKLVMQAYAFNPSDDILEKLLELNLGLAEKEKHGESVIGPWTPV